MRERPFGFLSCLGCRFFLPKRSHLSVVGETANPAFVGFCTCTDDVRWTVWRGLERAVELSAGCPDREPRLVESPRCRLFEATTDSSIKSYPESCVYYQTAACPLPMF